MISKSSLQAKASLFSWFPKKTDLLIRHQVLDERQLTQLLRRERLRSFRRGIGFCLLLFQRSKPVSASDLEKLLEDFGQRLRVTDDVGILENKLAVVLPDTTAEGGQLVAGDLQAIATRMGLSLECELIVSDDGSEDPFSPTAAGPHFEIRPKQFESNDDQPLGGSVQTAVALAPISSLKPRLQHVPEKLGLTPALVGLSVPKWKRAIDLLGASVGMIALSPLFVVVGASICFESKGGIFFKQLREGKDGKAFWIYKFRTMEQGADDQKHSLRQFSEQDGPAFKMTNDPRVTRVGKVLRRTCIDEIPQLINVIKGEMSLVGPRPLPVNESMGCDKWQRRRLDLLPGMTCIWQVQGKRDIPFAQWMRMDLEYGKRQSLTFDLHLIVRTILVALRMKGSV